VTAQGGIDHIALGNWRWVLDVNLIGAVNGVRTFLRHMRAHGEGGYIVNTASVAVIINSVHGFHPYPASKFAVLAMSEGLAAELKPLGIGVSVLCPGFVRTNIRQSARNRAERYGPTTPADAADPLHSWFAEPLRGGMDPADAARRVLAAIRDNELYVFTHPERRGAVKECFQAILAAFDRAAASPVWKDQWRRSRCQPRSPSAEGFDRLLRRSGSNRNLPNSLEEAPDGSVWIHELKLNGHRMRPDSMEPERKS
jgi:short-subunit dehydrogenase